MSGILILWVILVVLFSNFIFLELMYNIEIFIVDFSGIASIRAPFTTAIIFG